MSAKSIASKPRTLHVLCCASALPNTDSEYSSKRVLIALTAPSPTLLADGTSSSNASISASYEYVSFMPDLRWSGFVFGNQTLPLAASGTLSPRVRAVLPAQVQRSAVKPSEAHSL